MAALDVVSTWPVATASVVVVDRDGVVASVGPDVPQWWASITKPLTALAVLVAVDRGAIGLDNPAGPPGSTVRHLLAHASGISVEDDRQLAAPGRRRIYSNRGYDILGDVVTQASGPFADRFAEWVLRPLGMDASRLEGSPAHGVHGPIGDLARVARELLAPTLVPRLTTEATQVAFPGLSGVLPGFGRQDPNDWGLGVEIRDAKSPHWTGSRNSPATFGHFGQSGSFLWVDPEAGLACGCLTDRPFGPWAAEVWPVLSDRVLEEYAPG
jgi:CubicO group peptidase (beta-lactamase class C family)